MRAEIALEQSRMILAAAVLFTTAVCTVLLLLLIPLARKKQARGARMAVVILIVLVIVVVIPVIVFDRSLALLNATSGTARLMIDPGWLHRLAPGAISLLIACFVYAPWRRRT